MILCFILLKVSNDYKNHDLNVLQSCSSMSLTSLRFTTLY